ncbi:hypothetical protein [Paraburkholderia sp. BR14320]|uniref:hypothetical protein n=1 Tax=Paraburkholderia TaxID=1822464 RepID=UPI0034CF4BCF
MSYFDDLQALAKLHAEIADELDRKLESIGAKPDPAVMLKNLSALADSASADVDDAIRQRDAVTRYWDERIASLKAQAAERAQAVKAAQDAQGGAPAPEPPPKPAPRVVAKKAARQPK